MAWFFTAACLTRWVATRRILLEGYMNPEFAVRVEGPYDGSACIFASPNGRIGTRRRSGDRLRDLQLSIHLRRARRLFRKPLVSASALYGGQVSPNCWLLGWVGGFASAPARWITHLTAVVQRRQTQESGKTLTLFLTTPHQCRAFSLSGGRW